jgi:hypothetical protein
MSDFIEREMPNGEIWKFPSSMGEDRISDAIEKNFPGTMMPAKPESLKDKILRYGIKRPLSGIDKFATNLSMAPLDFLSQFSTDIEKNRNKYLKTPVYENIEKDLNLPQVKNWGDILAEEALPMGLSMILPSANIGRAGQAINNIPKAGPFINRMVSEALPQMGLSAIEAERGHGGNQAALTGLFSAPFSAASQLSLSTKPRIQKLASNLLGGGSAFATELALHEAGAPEGISVPAAIAMGFLGKKAAGTEAMMMQELAGGKDWAKAKKRLEAAERIGLDFLTPEEAFNSPFLARQQGRLGKTEEGSELMYDKFQKRVDSEEQAINKLLNTIHNPEIMTPQAQSLYAKAYPSEFFPSDSLGTEVIRDAIKTITNKPAYKDRLKDTPINTLGFWDLVKESLDDAISSAESAGNLREARIIKGTRKDLLDEMDLVGSYENDLGKITSPYKEARSLEERKFTRQTLQDAFDKSDIKSGHAFYKVLNSKKGFDDLMHHLRDVPEAQTTLKDMRELFKDFRKESTINKVRGLEQVGMKQDRNNLAAMLHFLEDKLAGGKHDKEAIEFITDKNWADRLRKVNKLSKGQIKAAKAIKRYGKPLSQFTPAYILEEE